MFQIPSSNSWHTLFLSPTNSYFLLDQPFSLCLAHNISRITSNSQNSVNYKLQGGSSMCPSMSVVSLVFTLLSWLFLETAYHLCRHFHGKIGKYKCEGLTQVKASSLHTQSVFAVSGSQAFPSQLKCSFPFYFSKLVKKQDKEQTLHGYHSPSRCISRRFWWIRLTCLNIMLPIVDHCRYCQEYIYSVPHMEDRIIE